MMIWMICLGRALVLVASLGIALELCGGVDADPSPLPIILMFPIIAYTYQTIAWVKGDCGDRTFKSWSRLRRPSYREAINAWIICLFSLITAFVSALVLSLAAGGTLAIIFGNESLESAGAMGKITGRLFADFLQSPIMGLMVFSLFVLLYRYEEWAQQWKRSRKLKKPSKPVKPVNLQKNKISPTPVDPIDLELDQLRANTGLIKMKSPRKNPEK